MTSVNVKETHDLQNCVFSLCIGMTISTCYWAKLHLHSRQNEVVSEVVKRGILVCCTPRSILSEYAATAGIISICWCCVFRCILFFLSFLFIFCLCGIFYGSYGLIQTKTTRMMTEAMFQAFNVNEITIPRKQCPIGLLSADSRKLHDLRELNRCNGKCTKSTS